MRSKKNVEYKYTKKELCPYLKFGNDFNNVKVKKLSGATSGAIPFKNRLSMARTTDETIF